MEDKYNPCEESEWLVPKSIEREIYDLVVENGKFLQALQAKIEELYELFRRANIQ